jgi:hypothetical protein
MARKLFLVYEIEPDTQRAAVHAGKRAPVGFTSTPRGCYFAGDAESACTMAAERLGRPGVLAAVATSIYNLKFKPAEVTKGDVRRMKEQAEGD